MRSLLDSLLRTLQDDIGSRSVSRSSSSSSSSRASNDQKVCDIPLVPYTLYSLFRVTPKKASQGGGRFGGFQTFCPYHKKSPKTGCKKWSPLLGSSTGHRTEAPQRLLDWCASSCEFTHQRQHVGRALVSNPNLLPSNEELRARLQALAPPEAVLDDEALNRGACSAVI